MCQSTTTAAAVIAAKMVRLQEQEAALFSRGESLARIGGKLTPSETRRMVVLNAWWEMLEMVGEDLEFAEALAAKGGSDVSEVRAAAYKWATVTAPTLCVCSKCKGSGRHRSMVAGGVCFGCNGKGMFPEK